MIKINDLPTECKICVFNNILRSVLLSLLDCCSDLWKSFYYIIKKGLASTAGRKMCERAQCVCFGRVGRGIAQYSTNQFAWLLCYLLLVIGRECMFHFEYCSSKWSLNTRCPPWSGVIAAAATTDKNATLKTLDHERYFSSMTKIIP